MEVPSKVKTQETQEQAIESFDSILPAPLQQQPLSLDEDEIIVGGEDQHDMAAATPVPSVVATPFSSKGGNLADRSFWNQQHMVLSDSVITPRSEDASDASLDAVSLVFGEEATSKDVWESFVEDIDAEEISVDGHFSPVIAAPPQFDQASVPLPPVESKESRLLRIKQSFAGSAAVPSPPEAFQQNSESTAPFIRSVSDKYTVAAAVASAVRSSNISSESSGDAPAVDGTRVTANSDRLRVIARARIEQAQQRARARQQEN